MIEILKLNQIFFEAYELHLTVYSSTYSAYEATEKYMEELIKRGFAGQEGRVYSNFESFIQSYSRTNRKKNESI